MTTTADTAITTDTTTEKSARLSCRIRPLVKEQAEAALEEKARAVLAENKRIVLSEHAFGEFLAAITGEPEKPSKELLAAVARYKRHEPVKPTSERQGHP